MKKELQLKKERKKTTTRKIPKEKQNNKNNFEKTKIRRMRKREREM